MVVIQANEGLLGWLEKENDTSKAPYEPHVARSRSVIFLYREQSYKSTKNFPLYVPVSK